MCNFQISKKAKINSWNRQWSKNQLNFINNFLKKNKHTQKHAGVLAGTQSLRIRYQTNHGITSNSDLYIHIKKKATFFLKFREKQITKE